MNQREKLVPPGTSPLEDRHVLEVRHGQSISYPFSATPTEASPWATYGVDNSHIQNGFPSNSTYGYEQHVLPPQKDSMNGATEASSLSLGSTSIGQDYNGYMTYQNSTDSSGYGNAGYTGYYSGYQQQQPQNSFAQPVAAYQSTSTSYHPPASYQNTGSYASSASYSNTYYNPADYQSTTGYSNNNYSNQTSQWNESTTTYSSYTQYPYSSYPPASTSAYSSSNASLSSVQYQQQYKQWAEHYAQTEVSCAPGTESLSVTASSQAESVNSGISHGTAISNQTTPPIVAPWRPDAGSSEVPPLQPSGAVGVGYDAYWKHTALGYHNHHTPSGESNHLQPSDAKAAYSNYPEEQKRGYIQSHLQYPVIHQVPQIHQMSEQINPSANAQSANRVQIPTNPRIVSNLALGLTKTEKAAPEEKPAYISISFPKTNDKTSMSDATNSTLKPGGFPKSLRRYVERALARCKDDAQIAASQAVMKEIITNATADGTLHSRDWDKEPLFPLPNGDGVSKDLQTPTSFRLFKKSPTRRTKSRWEPLAEEKLASESTPRNSNVTRYGGWMPATERDQKASVDSSEGKEDVVQAPAISNMEHKFSNFQKPFKKQRHSLNVAATENGDASSDSDKDVNLTAEERRKRESRSKRFDRGHGNPTEKHFKSKVAGAANLYTRRATALILGKTLDDSGSRAVEDIDWDALTVRGTSREIEKRYLRLTSAPDPATVRPEEVLEKALLMVQNSQKNYLYKCDQLKSIRQDLTVQRIRNHLTVKVYEIHARLALEVRDLAEYNQCQSQLKTLYAEGIEGCHLEFTAYGLLSVILHSHNIRDLLSLMSRLSPDAKQNDAVRHALAVRRAVTSGNYVMFFRLYKTAPNLNSCIMDQYADKMRYRAVTCICKSHRPTVPVSYVAQMLGFANTLAARDGNAEMETNGLEECAVWLKAHGACLVTDNSGETQLDTKASASSLYVPEPEDAVAHGDANLAVNDFLARAP